MNYRVRRY